MAGIVVGSDGKGGSGTCVRLDDGAIALLTAKHVVLECLRNTGRIGIGAYNVRYQEPELIRMDSTQQGDAAYLVFRDIPESHPAVPFAEWTRNRADLAPGQRVIACGFPGRLKRFKGRKMMPGFAWIGDQILSIDGNRITSRINETHAGMPETFHGLSGGGVFTEDGRFVGVIVEEKRRITKSLGVLHTLQPAEFSELYTPFQISADAPPGPWHSENQIVSITLYKPDGSVQARVGSLAQYLWSATQPDHPHGRVGRLLSLEFVIPGIERHYPININSLFTWGPTNTAEDQQNAMNEEFRFLLLRMRWLIKEENGNLVLQVNPLT